MTTNKKHLIKWYELSEAAELLGVHFTTLRRWADNGDIEHLRTPGGKRRFTSEMLFSFINNHHQAASSSTPPLQLIPLAMEKTRLGLQGAQETGATWMKRIDPEQRMSMRGTGNRLMALLMQYNSHSNNAEVYLEESQRIATEYGTICFQSGLSVSESLQAFMIFRGSILDALHETTDLPNMPDKEGQNLYHRTSKFLDNFMIAMVDAFCIHQQKSNQ